MLVLSSLKIIFSNIFTGSKAKLGGLAGCVLWEVWNNGFQDTLSAYHASICSLVTDMTIFRTRLEELQTLIPVRLDIERLLPMLLLACPQELFLYACRILRLFITDEQSAAFNNFITVAASTFATNDAFPVQLFREAESFNILDSCSSLTNSLQILTMLTHAVGEVKVFYSAATSISRQDFVHVKASLSKLWQLSVSFGKSLQSVRMWSSWNIGFRERELETKMLEYIEKRSVIWFDCAHQGNLKKSSMAVKSIFQFPNMLGVISCIVCWV